MNASTKLGNISINKKENKNGGLKFRFSNV